MRPAHAIALAASGLALAVASAAPRWARSSPPHVSTSPDRAASEPAAPDPVRVAEASGRAPDITQDEAAGGRHYRLAGSHGPVHVWTPPGHRPETAGIVVYAHGYYTDVDDAWRDHRLADQFAASGVDALFIVPEVPSGSGRALRWESLGELIREVRQRLSVVRPWGPVVAVGHSGAYRSLVTWLHYRPLSHVILIDGMYGQEDEFRTWLERKRGDAANRLTTVSIDTLRWTEPFARTIAGVGSVHALDWIPERVEDVPEAARNAQILYMRAQYGHMELVTEGRVIPLLLGLTRLPRRAP